jgi:hypothetical protein
MTTDSVLNDYLKKGDRLKPFQVAAVWKRLAKSVQGERDGRVRRNFWINHEANLRALFIHTMHSVNDFDGRSTATVTHSIVKLATSLTTTGSISSDIRTVEPLWNALRVRTTKLVQSNDFDAHSISNLLWAYAKADEREIDEHLLNDLANLATLRADEFEPQGLSNVAWAFATLNHKAPSLFTAVAKHAEERIDEFNPQDLMNQSRSLTLLAKLRKRAFPISHRKVWRISRGHLPPCPTENRPCLMLLLKVHKNAFVISNHNSCPILPGHSPR